MKVYYGDDVRKFNCISNYQQLLTAISNSFGYHVLKCKFYYIDEENDQITVNDEDDFLEAVKCWAPRPAKLYLTKFAFKQGNTISVSSWLRDDYSWDFDNMSDISIIKELSEEIDEIPNQNKNKIYEYKNKHSKEIIRKEIKLNSDRSLVVLKNPNDVFIDKLSNGKEIVMKNIKSTNSGSYEEQIKNKEDSSFTIAGVEETLKIKNKGIPKNHLKINNLREPSPK